MNMTSTLNMEWRRRRATFTLPFDRPSIGLKKDVPYACKVHGCFQVNDGDEDINPYFVVELEDGSCTYVAPEHLRFIKEADEC